MSAKRSRAPMCRLCQKRISVPKGWAPGGAAVRRHYWAKHPEVMRGETPKGKSR
ncbi:MAG TPA: hypothetical protein VNC78_05745 [Actinomycetota bacterium]|nr:hypothetical protein [Actinomycetota bacterium]